MPSSQGTSTLRRPILRFELASISIDDRPNAYKNPQLVLKPQLVLAPRWPYTGSRPRVPVWRHYLMVHVKDKADELVKLDLDTFKSDPSSAAADTPLRNHITCSFSQRSFIFRYSKDTEGGSHGSSTLRITLQKPPDLDTVLQELGGLGVHIESEHAVRDHGYVSGLSTFGSLAQLGRTMSPVYRPSSNPRQLSSSSPPLTTNPSSPGGYPAYLETQFHTAALQRPPSQPADPSMNLQHDQRPWSPAFVPSRPATTLGLPGILGEGIYKVSKIGSTSSVRPRVRRTSTILEQQGPKLYTVSRHFDKTLSRADILHSSRARYLGHGLPSGLQSSNPPGYPSRSPSLSVAGTESQPKPGQDIPVNQSLPRPPSAVEGLPVNLQHQPRLRRLRTINDPSSAGLSSGVNDQQHHFFLPSVAEEKAGSSFSQPPPASRAVGLVDDIRLFNSSPTLFDYPTKKEMEDDWLLQVSQIQHQGLCEASRVWDELWVKASAEALLAKSAENLSEILSKYEGEFVRRWEGVVAATAQKMRDARPGHVH